MSLWRCISEIDIVGWQLIKEVSQSADGYEISAEFWNTYIITLCYKLLMIYKCFFFFFFFSFTSGFNNTFAISKSSTIVLKLV